MKKEHIFGIIFALLFGVLTVLVLKYDVAPAGVFGYSIGFANLNTKMHLFTGVHLGLYELTNYIGYFALLVVAGFAFLGLCQWIHRKKISLVDPEILHLGLLYIIVLGIYVFFEKFAINYRPVPEPGELELEPSFPSSHTILVFVVLATAVFLFSKYIKPVGLRLILDVLFILTIIFTVAARFYSGFHWFTDILAGLLISLSLLFFYIGNIKSYRDKRGTAHAPQR